MYQWQKQIQIIVDGIDNGIKAHQDEDLTLGRLSKKLRYSQFHTSAQFTDIT